MWKPGLTLKEVPSPDWSRRCADHALLRGSGRYQAVDEDGREDYSPRIIRAADPTGNPWV